MLDRKTEVKKRMRQELKLSLRILIKTPIGRRGNSMANLKWISRNVKLSNDERREVIDAIKAMTGVDELYGAM